jgi:hypothetical protein
MFRAATRLYETAAASAQVIAHRKGVIETAARDPMAGDYRELSLMVTEKLAAFSEAGTRLSQGWWSAQLDMAAQFQQLGALMLRGRPASAADFEAVQRKGTRTASRALTAAGEAIVPIHKAATANARRLKTSKAVGTRKKASARR